MTVIIGIKHGKKVYLAGDSAAVGDGSWSTIADPKVFKVDDEMIIGFTGSFRMGQILQYSFTPPARKRNEDAFKYMRTSVVDRLIQVLEEGKSINYEEGKEAYCGNFLIGYRGELYEVQDDFSVLRRALPYAAIGIGEQFALGALHVLFRDKSKIEPQKTILLAMDAVKEFCNGVRAPFVTIEC